MDIEALKIAVVAFVATHQAWAPLIVAVLAFCESLALLSLLVPATVMLLGIGAHDRRHGLELLADLGRGGDRRGARRLALLRGRPLPRGRRAPRLAAAGTTGA